jgi:muramoyltetrapeptide carboxypeptidase
MPELYRGKIPIIRRSLNDGFIRGTPDDEPSITLEETLEDRIYPLGTPAAYGLSFGHIANQLPLPLGIRARFDAAERTLTLLEPAVL